ncbi:MAG TPA: YdcF family protein [Candidatus Binatia bacterium]|jgi:uncharacterized SAM-binding protein YcdF (DUF218 family)|nr:YdcF family protein [Candidatus Binatia bacterium]
MRLRWLATAVVVALPLLGIAGLVAGRVLVVADPLPPHADAIVVMAGSVSDRVLEAARLYRLGLAPLVVITHERLPRGGATLRARGVHLPESHELARRGLRDLGVPDDAIRDLPRRARSTRSEARVLARWACKDHVKSLIVVTSPSHTLRARLLLRQALVPSVDVTVRPAPAAMYRGGRWWRDRRVAKEVLSEYEKLANFWLVERWSPPAPCGGLAGRSAA